MSTQKAFLYQAIQFSQTALIQPIHFSISIDFDYSQLNIKTVPFQTIQFSINMQFSSIWPKDRAQDWVDPGAMAMKGRSAFPKALALLEPNHQIV